MYTNIVKILQEEGQLFGSGIVISENKVLTAAHIVTKDDNVKIIWEKSFVGIVDHIDNIIAIISVDDIEFSEKFNTLSNKLLFTKDEIITDSSKWQVQGFITNNQIEHQMAGVGIYHVYEGIADCSLSNISTGISNNYQGLSGSPVIVNERAVGILQIQRWDTRGELGVFFSSIDLFEKNLPDESVIDSLFVTQLTQKCRETCNSIINKNKDSAKYIPDIFVEEGFYKDNLRCFSLPLLFINRIIEDLNKIDFTKVNFILEGKKLQKIQFSDYLNKVNADTYNSIVIELKKEIKRCLNFLEQLKNDEKSKEGSLEEIFSQGIYLKEFLKWKLEKLLNQLEFLSYRFLLLTRNAGQGKTNFVCDFTENFLMKRKIPTVYYNASDFCELPSIVIKRFLTINGMYDEEYMASMLTEIWEKTKVPFVIVIDGLNENISLPHFENYIKQSIDELIQLPFIKIIMTTRNELLEERFGQLTQQNVGNTFFRMDMSRKRESRFSERIFEGYLRYFDVHIVNKSLFESTYRMLTNDTLLLRFFCEVNRHKKEVYMYNIYKYALFNQYYEKKKEEMKYKNIPGGEMLFDQLVDLICKYMVENRLFNNIPKNILNINEIQLLDILLEADVIFKEDQIIKKGFLEENETVLSFTFDEFRDFCITKYLLKQVDALISFPKIWETMCNENWSILEGVEKYVFFLAKTTAQGILPIIDKSRNYQRMYWENIWNLEDKYITNEDIQEIKKQFEIKSRYRKKIIECLLLRRDRSYFKIANIDLLFEIMDDIADRPGEFDNFINMYFPISKVDKYNREVDQEDCVLCCDDIINHLMQGLDEENTCIDYYDFLKLSIYLYEIMPENINKLWKKALMKCSNVIFKITEEFLKKENTAIFIKYNLEDIYSSLIDISDYEKFKELYIKYHSEKDYKNVNMLLEEKVYGHRGKVCYRF